MHRRALAALTLAAAPLVGCNAIVPTHSAPLADVKDDRTIVTDEAMQIREYPPTSATYPSGAVVAGSTGFAFEVNPDLAAGSYGSYSTYGLINPALFFVNLVTMPVTLIQHPGPQVYEGLVIPPSRTAVPSLPVRPETYLARPTTGPAAPIPPAELGVPSNAARNEPAGPPVRATSAPGVVDPAAPPVYAPTSDDPMSDDVRGKPSTGPTENPVIFGEPLKMDPNSLDGPTTAPAVMNP